MGLESVLVEIGDESALDESIAYNRLMAFIARCRAEDSSDAAIAGCKTSYKASFS